ARVYKAIQEVDNQLIAVKTVKVHIPARFPGRDLALFEEESMFTGICAFIVDDAYAVSTVPAMMRTEPTLTNTVTVGDEDYLELTYEPGARIVTNLNLVKVDSLLYKIYDEIIAKGRVPWYLGYEDLGRIFEHSVYHAGESVGPNPAIMEIDRKSTRLNSSH